MKLFAWSVYACGYFSGFILPSQILIVISYEIRIWDLEVTRQREMDSILEEFDKKLRLGIFGLLKNYAFKLLGLIFSG